MGDGAPKSALEIALERLKKSDEAAGIVDKPLTEDQRRAIADARSFYEAKLAEAKILLESKLAATFEPEARATLEDAHRMDVDRLIRERDARIERLRRGES